MAGDAKPAFLCIKLKQLPVKHIFQQLKNDDSATQIKVKRERYKWIEM